MVSCSHKSCGREKQVWLPTIDYLGSEVNLHPWCIHCGVVKNISDDKAHKLGYWTNILSKISYLYSIKKVQKRIITRELSSHEYFTDIYCISGSIQRKIFNEIVTKYCNINPNCIDTLIY